MNDPSMNPLVRGGQHSRPTQPTSPLTAAEMAHCGAIVQAWRNASSSADGSMPVAVLAYLTDTSSLHPWVLGLSAAAHGVPLIVAGHGRRWGGAGIKLPAARRAVEALSTGLPHATAVVFADGSDTAIANPPSGEALSALSRTASQTQALVAGECNSWPVCYREQYSRHRAHSLCVQRRSTGCFPNSGLYAGRTTSLLLLLTALEAEASDPRRRPPERGDDQAALHHLYLQEERGGGEGADGTGGGGKSGGSAAGGPAIGRGATSTRRRQHLDIRVDDEQLVFASLHACKGSGDRRVLRIRGADFSVCHHGAHEPLRELHRRRQSNGSVALGFGARRPLLVHASGNHDRLARAFLGDNYAQRLGSLGLASSDWSPRKRAAAIERLWHQQLTPSASLGGLGRRGEGRRVMDHPVLLVDSASGTAPCAITTVGALLGDEQ